MAIVYTQTGFGLENIPDDGPGSLTPRDFFVTEASAASVTAAAEVNGTSVVVEAEGEFTGFEGLIGKSWEEASGLLSGTYSKEVVVGSWDDAQTVATYQYVPPREIEQESAFDETLAGLSEEWSGNDLFIGDRDNPSSDDVRGYGGNDIFYMTYGFGEYERFDGDEGVDTVIFESASSHWDILPVNLRFNVQTQTVLTGYLVEDTRYTSSDMYGENGHILEIVNVERLQFTDQTIALDFDRGQNGYQAASLITTVFGSEWITSYFESAVDMLDEGLTVNEIAQLVIDLGLVDTGSNEQFVAAIYENVVGRTPDSLTQALYSDQLSTGDLTHADLIAIGSQSPLVELQIPDLSMWQQNGLGYGAP